MTKQTKKSIILAVAALLLATAIWGTSFPILKIALNSFTPLWFIGIRFTLATGLLLIISIPRLKKEDNALLKHGVMIGIPMGLAYTCQTIGLMYTSAANNAFITATYVVIVPFLVLLTGKKVHLSNVVIAVITLLGLAIFTFSGSLSVASGDIWTLGCAFLFAVHMTMLGKFSADHDTLLLTMMQMLMVAVINLILAVFLEPLPSLSDFTPEIIRSMAYCILFPSVIAFFIQTWVQRILSPMLTAVLMMSEAVFGAFFGWLILGDSFPPRKLMGAAIMLICMLLSVVLENKHDAADKLPKPASATTAPAEETENKPE